MKKILSLIFVAVMFFGCASFDTTKTGALTSHTESTLDDLLLALDSDADGDYTDEDWYTSFLTETDVDDTPVDSATTDPISSNWAYDHVADSDPHTGYVLESAIGETVLAPDGSGSGLTDVDAATGDSATAFFDAGQIEAARGGTGIDTSSSTGIPFITAGVWAVLKGTKEAAADPGVGDDSADGYVVGSRWVNTTDDKEFICLDATEGAAVWTETTGAGAGSGDVTTVLDDTTGDVPVLRQAPAAFTDEDATPDVSTKTLWKTANTAATSITDFDGSPADGQLLVVVVGDANTTFDFTSSGLTHPYGTDYTAAVGDVLFFVYDNDNTTWRSVGLGGAGAEQIIAELNANGSTALSATILPDVSATTDGLVPTTSGITNAYVLTKQADGSAAWAESGAGTDSAAIHDNVSGEIVAVTEKTYTASNDELLIEDSEDSNNKKSVKASNLMKTSGIGDTVPFYDTDAATKKIQFDASNTTAGQTRVFGFPDANGTVVTTDATQTLTNKTIKGSGEITGAVNISSKTDAAYTIGTDAASESYGTLFINGDNDAIDFTLPSAASGMNLCIMQGQGSAGAITIQPNTGDYLVVDGVRGSAATDRSSSGAAGDKICVIAIDATDWIVTSESGTWSE